MPWALHMALNSCQLRQHSACASPAMVTRQKKNSTVFTHTLPAPRGTRRKPDHGQQFFCALIDISLCADDLQTPHRWRHLDRLLTILWSVHQRCAKSYAELPAETRRIAASAAPQAFTQRSAGEDETPALTRFFRHFCQERRANARVSFSIEAAPKPSLSSPIQPRIQFLFHEDTNIIGW